VYLVLSDLFVACMGETKETYCEVRVVRTRRNNFYGHRLYRVLVQAQAGVDDGVADYLNGVLSNILVERKLAALFVEDIVAAVEQRFHCRFDRGPDAVDRYHRVWGVAPMSVAS
jgi:hypothetical protein